MSSSKIIKQSAPASTDISEFCFRDIGRHGRVPVAEKSTASFTPMAGVATASENSHDFVQMLMPVSDDQQETDQDEEEALDPGPPPIEIMEEELNQRINDSFNAGLTEGKELAERGLVNVFRSLRASSEAIHNLRDKIFRESEDEVINLIMLVARKVIVREIAEDRSILAGVVQNALASLTGREEITVRINPDDYQLVTSGHETLLHKELHNERLLLKPDPSIAAGFCLIDTDMGIIDASLDSQLDHIYQTLLEQRVLAVANPVATKNESNDAA